MPTIPRYVPPVPAADTLNRQRSANKTNANVLAEGAPLPVILGEAQVGGKIYAVHYASGTSTWTIGVAWCIGPVDSIQSVLMNGAAPAAGVTREDYLGTSGQAVSPLLSAAISGYSDGLIYSAPLGDVGACHSVFQYSNEDYRNFPRFHATIRGALTNAGAWSDSPAHAARFLIENAAVGLGETADATSFGDLATTNAETVISEERRTIGLVLDEPMPTIEWLAILAGYCSAWIFKRGDTWFATPDRPRAPDDTLDESDFDTNSLEVDIADDQDTPTVIELVYTDTSEAIWRDRVYTAELDGVSDGTVPRRVSRVKMPGVTRYSQAAREANERLNKLQRNLTVSFSAFHAQRVRELGDVLALEDGIGLDASFRVNSPPRIRDGRVDVQCVEYRSTDYVDTEETPPANGSSSLIAGPGVSVVTGANGSMALKINWGTNNASSPGEAAICAVGSDNLPDFSSDGFIRWQGSVVNIEDPNTSGGAVVNTGRGSQKGLIAFDTTLSTPFTMSGGNQRNTAFVWKDSGGTWRYDENQANAGVAFTPTADMVALGWIETATADLIDSGGLFGEPVPLTLASFPGADNTAENNRWSDVADDDGNRPEDGATVNVLHRQTTAPAGPHTTGDMWFDTDDELLYKWNGAAWERFAPEGGDTATTVSDSGSGALSASATIVRGGAVTQISGIARIQGTATAGTANPFPLTARLERGSTTLREWQILESMYEAGGGGDPAAAFGSVGINYTDTTTGTGSTTYTLSITQGTAFSEVTEIEVTQTHYD